MWFFPYKLDINLYRIPLLTILVCLACISVFLYQLKSAHAFGQNLYAYCKNETDANLHAILQAIDDDAAGSGCANVFMAIRNAADHDAEIVQLAREVRNLDFYKDADADLKYKQEALRSGYENFELFVPKALTEKLAYQPRGFNVVTMVTSTFAHASWGHLLGNLLFFFIFASCIESALGSLATLAVFLVLAIVTSVAYSYSASSAAGLPAIGLSGVAMGMMAMLTTMLPRAKIWCFFWFLLFVRRFTLPLLLIAAWYIGWDVYDLNHQDATSRINYMAHVSGALTGVALGLLVRVFARQRLLDMSLAVPEY